MKSKNIPLLSIVIPVYNVEKYLSECLESIIQVDGNFEIILVDDGSKDNSKSICEEYSNKDSRIKFYHKSNNGVSSARNFGIHKCNGTHLMFVDSDDKLNKNWWSIVYPKIINNEFDCIYIQNFGQKLDYINITKQKLVTYILGQNDEKISMKGPCSKIYKTKVIKENNILFNEQINRGEDILFNISTIYYIKSFKMYNESFYLYRKNMNSITRSYSENKKTILDKYYQCLKEKLQLFDFEETQISKITSGTRKNIFFIIIGNVSFLKRYSAAKKVYLKIKSNNDYNIEYVSLNKYEKVIKKLWDNNLFFLLFHFWKFVRLFKHVTQKIKNKNEEIFFKI